MRAAHQLELLAVEAIAVGKRVGDAGCGAVLGPGTVAARYRRKTGDGPTGADQTASATAGVDERKVEPDLDRRLGASTAECDRWPHRSARRRTRRACALPQSMAQTPASASGLYGPLVPPLAREPDSPAAPAPDMPVIDAANSAMPIERACRASHRIPASFHIAVSLLGDSSGYGTQRSRNATSRETRI